MSLDHVRKAHEEKQKLGEERPFSSCDSSTTMAAHHMARVHLAPFQGHGEEDVTGWLEYYESVCRASKSDPAEVFPIYCEKKILSRLKAVGAQTEPKQWAELRGVILATYGRNANKNTIQTALMDRRQSSEESVKEYADAMDSLAQQIGWKPDDITSLFTRGLRDTIFRSGMVSMKFNTFLEAVDMAKTIEENLESRHPTAAVPLTGPSKPKTPVLGVVAEQQAAAAPQTTAPPATTTTAASPSSQPDLATILAAIVQRDQQQLVNQQQYQHPPPPYRQGAGYLNGNGMRSRGGGSARQAGNFPYRRPTQSDQQSSGRRCFYCHTAGHVKSQCNIKARIDEAHAELERRRAKGGGFFGAMYDTDPLGPLMLTSDIVIGDGKPDALIDSGATASFVRKGSLHLIKRYEEGESSTRVFRTGNSQVLDHSGTILASVVFEQGAEPFKQRFIVTEDLPFDVVLGTDALRAAGAAVLFKPPMLMLPSGKKISLHAADSQLLVINSDEELK